MADEQTQQEQQDQQASAEQGPTQGGVKVDPAFFDAVNAYLVVSDEQTQQFGPKPTCMAMMYAGARHAAFMYLSTVNPINAANERKDFLDYMTTLYRRMLNEHLDGVGEDRGIDVGDSELAAEYAAAGVQVGRMKQPTPANDYVAAAGAVPPVEPANE